MLVTFTPLRSVTVVTFTLITPFAFTFVTFCCILHLFYLYTFYLFVIYVAQFIIYSFTFTTFAPLPDRSYLPPLRLHLYLFCSCVVTVPSFTFICIYLLFTFYLLPFVPLLPTYTVLRFAQLLYLAVYFTRLQLPFVYFTVLPQLQLQLCSHFICSYFTHVCYVTVGFTHFTHVLHLQF